MARLNKDTKVKEVRRNRKGHPEQVLDSGEQILNDEDMAESVTGTGAIAMGPAGNHRGSNMTQAMDKAKGNGLADRSPSNDSTGQAKTDTTDMGKEWPRRQKNTGWANSPMEVQNPGKMSEGMTPADIANTLEEGVDLENLFAAYARQTNYVTLNEFAELCQAHSCSIMPDERMFIELMAANPEFIFEEHHDGGGAFWVPTLPESAPPAPPRPPKPKDEARTKNKKKPWQAGGKEEEEGEGGEKKEWKKPWLESVDDISAMIAEDGSPFMGDETQEEEQEEEDAVGGGATAAPNPEGGGGALGVAFGGEETPEEEAAEGHSEGVVAAAAEEGGEEGAEIGAELGAEMSGGKGGGLAAKLGFEPLFCPLCGSEMNEAGDPGGHLDEEIMAAGGPVTEDMMGGMGSVGHDESGEAHYDAEPPPGMAQMGAGGEMDDIEGGGMGCECHECGNAYQEGDNFCSKCGCEICPDGGSDELAGDAGMGGDGMGGTMPAGEEMHPGSMMGMEGTDLDDLGLAEAGGGDGLTKGMGKEWPRKQAKQNTMGANQNEFGDSSHAEPKDGLTKGIGKEWPRKHSKQGRLGANQNEFGDSSHANASDSITSKQGKEWPRKQKNDGGQWEPFGNNVSGGGKMSGGTKKMYENINLLARQAKRFLAETAKACGNRIAGCGLEFQVSATDAIKPHNRTQLAEALADAEELLQVFDHKSVVLEAGFYNKNGELVYETRIPLRSIQEREPLIAGDLTLFRFHELAHDYADRLVNEGITCRAAAHNWGSAIIAKLPFAQAVSLFESIREAFGSSVGKLTIGSLAQQMGVPWAKVRFAAARLMTQLHSLRGVSVQSIGPDTPIATDDAETIAKALGKSVRTTDVPAYGSTGVGQPRTYT
jgi:hypothetical protein